MGQYHLTVNLDRQEFLMPHTLGDGLKLIEQASNPNPGIMTALHILLAGSNGRGGGDFAASSRMVGRWAGDRIAVIGDYAEKPDIRGCDASAIYDECRTSYRYFEIEWTTAAHVDPDEMFYLSSYWSAGLWQCTDDPLRGSTHDGINVCNVATGTKRRIAAEAPVALLGTKSGKWCDLSFTMARYIETEFVGQYQGDGWRHWHDRHCA